MAKAQGNSALAIAGRWGLALARPLHFSASMKAAVLVLSLFTLVATTAVARAQPAPACSPCYLTPPGQVAAPRLAIELTEKEVWLLERNDISKPRYVVGGVLESAYGFGIGHIVQGRWLEKGWVFTAGELSAVAAVVYGFREVERNSWCRAGEFGTECGDKSLGRALIFGGIATYVGFRIWGAVDAWAAPMAEAGRRRTLRRLLGLPPGAKLAPVISTTPDASGPMAGFDLRF